ncbi:MAG: hypothetical protein ACOCU8_02495 [Patescibacteria group bacterium]
MEEKDFNQNENPTNTDMGVPEQSASVGSPEDNSKGPVVGIVLIIIILIVGGIFVFTNREEILEPVEEDVEDIANEEDMEELENDISDLEEIDENIDTQTQELEDELDIISEEE